MNDNETFTVDTQTYVNPQVGVDETNAFIDNLRATQAAENAAISQQTHALGSDLPSSHGGLSGGQGIFEARYQTPQVNAMVAGLKNTAQSQALNTAMSNYQTYLQNEYNKAYRDYAAREKAKSNTGTGDDDDDDDDNVKTESTDQESTVAPEALSASKISSLYKQYLQGGLSADDAMKKAMETWNTTYQNGDTYVSY